MKGFGLFFKYHKQSTKKFNARQIHDASLLLDHELRNKRRNPQGFLIDFLFSIITLDILKANLLGEFLFLFYFSKIIRCNTLRWMSFRDILFPCLRIILGDRLLCNRFHYVFLKKIFHSSHSSF